MELKVLALQLGLPETATEAEVNKALGELKQAKQENERLQKENGELMLARITGLVEKAVAEKRLDEGKKAQFVELGKKSVRMNLKASLKPCSHRRNCPQCSVTKAASRWLSLLHTAN